LGNGGFQHPPPDLLRHLPDRRGGPGPTASLLCSVHRRDLGRHQRSARRRVERQAAHPLGPSPPVPAPLRRALWLRLPAALVGAPVEESDPVDDPRNGCLRVERHTSDAGDRALPRAHPRDDLRLQRAHVAGELPHVLQFSGLPRGGRGGAYDRRRHAGRRRDAAAGLRDRLRYLRRHLDHPLPAHFLRRARKCPARGPAPGSLATRNGAPDLEQRPLPLCRRDLHAELGSLRPGRRGVALLPGLLDRPGRSAAQDARDWYAHRKRGPRHHGGPGHPDPAALVMGGPALRQTTDLPGCHRLLGPDPDVIAHGATDAHGPHRDHGGPDELQLLGGAHAARRHLPRRHRLGRATHRRAPRGHLLRRQELHPQAHDGLRALLGPSGTGMAGIPTAARNSDLLQTARSGHYGHPHPGEPGSDSPARRAARRHLVLPARSPAL